MTMSGKRALAFVRKHGAVLQAGRGPLPTLVEAIAGEPIRGSWWGHPLGHQIFRALGEVHDSGEVAACRLARGKITLVHQRLWPALFLLRPRRRGPALDRVTQEHTSSGVHRNVVERWPDWLPASARQEAAALDEDAARALLGPVAELL
jgi:hypothetical protein